MNILRLNQIYLNIFGLNNIYNHIVSFIQVVVCHTIVCDRININAKNKVLTVFLFLITYSESTQLL